jgi:hypothetical protein
MIVVRLSFLLLALALLWLPRQWLRHGAVLFRRRRRVPAGRFVEPWRERESGDPRISFRSEFRKLRNYVDLLRGATGSLALFGGLGIPAAIMAEPDASRTVTYQVWGVRAGILLVGLLIQTIHVERQKLTFYPPIFYLAGLSVGLCEARGAAFAFALIWAINAGLPGAQSFLSIYALLLVVFGHLFAGRGDLNVITAGVLCFFPVLLSLLAKRPLLIPARKAARVRVEP